eukprot:TRINITY_DN2749_c0_g6_i1.p1 TRINITY_DN2749_c0_g6~~TRINITY_DN2749_c0_g6_i1.p1  ORF type:complete len:406 (-),score=62.03 TRINITY_DN2749_c0_g6_i1:166-1383(-)
MLTPQHGMKLWVAQRAVHSVFVVFSAFGGSTASLAHARAAGANVADVQQGPAPALPSVVFPLLTPSPTSAEVPAVADDPLGDCLEVPSGLCLAGTGGGPSVVVNAEASIRGLVLWYRFDKSLPVDESGHGHHLLDDAGALSAVPVGPGVMGRGASAFFDGRGLKRHVPRIDAFESTSFTAALWIYLLEDSVGSWRTIFSRGSNPDQTSPSLMLQPNSRRLHVRAATPRAEGGALDGSGLLPLRRWTHIAVTGTGSVLRLFVNGLKDGEVILEEPGATAEAVVTSVGDLHIGADPWRSGTKAYFDDFRWYDRALSQAEIKSMTLPSLTGMGADFVKLGCISCTFGDAQRSCGRRSHLCTVQELFAGGLHTARAMGWLALSPEVWFHESQGDERFTDVAKLGLCCTN